MAYILKITYTVIMIKSDLRIRLQQCEFHVITGSKYRCEVKQVAFSLFVTGERKSVTIVLIIKIQ